MGRYGDIVSFLPVLKNEFDTTGKKPSLVVAKDFADILDGVSYVEPIVYDGAFDDITGALEYLKTRNETATATQVVGIPDVLVGQVYGKHHGPQIICDSFQQDAWRLAGKLDLWPSQPPLVFDRRDKKREEELIKEIPKNKPWIVVSTGGTSSPFQYSDLLWEILNHSFPEFHIVDLGKIKAERFYDLLGIMDHPNTHAMILTDSGPLHLSYATQKPVHALVTDSPYSWHGAAWRPSYASYIRYKNFPRDVTRILGLIRGTIPLPPITNPDIIHVYCRIPDAVGYEKKRNDLAKKTWDKIGWVDCGLDDNCFVRHAGNVIPKQTRYIPLIKEMIRLACCGRKDSDIVVITNTDICVSTNIVEKIRAGLPAYAFRHDYRVLDEIIPDSEIAGDKYPGCDLFAMSVGWWRRNHHLYPDMVIGRHSWDRIMRELFKLAKGREIERGIYHQRHPSGWENPVALNTDLCNLRNARLAREWLTERNIPLEELEDLNYEGKFKRPDFSKLKV